MRLQACDPNTQGIEAGGSEFKAIRGYIVSLKSYNPVTKAKQSEGEAMTKHVVTIWVSLKSMVVSLESFWKALLFAISA